MNFHAIFTPDLGFIFIFIEPVYKNHEDDLSEMLGISLKLEKDKMDAFSSINILPLRDCD